MSPTAEVPIHASDLGSLVSSGFGQRQEYVYVVAIVHNNTDDVGQTVTVNFNALDDKGTILASRAQVEAFSHPQADHAVGTLMDVKRGQKVAKVDATLLVEDKGSSSAEPFPPMPTSAVTVTKGQYGTLEASFELSNTLKQAIKGPRIDVVCIDASRQIVGGGFDYPELVSASSKIKVDVDLLATTTPSACSVYVGAPTDWEGVEGVAQSPAPVNEGTPEAAFKAWVDKISPKDWSGQYRTLATAQRKLISEAAYVTCRTKNPIPATTWFKLVSIKDGGNDTVPGTSASLPSMIVSARVKMGKLTVPVDAHMYQEGGQWLWAMTSENLKGCGVI